METDDQATTTDLTAEAFLLLRAAFFDEDAVPIPYELRDKLNTQDDPFDEHIHKLLDEGLPGVRVEKATGPLITPDLVLMRRDLCEGAPREVLKADPERIAAVEVKKLERTASGGIARASGMDYNTTPPCGMVRVYDGGGSVLDIRGFYLFACQEALEDRPGHYRVSALVLCDGDLLNADFDYYLSIVGERTKEIGVGSYGDGANRNRPMVIFANPLGAPELDHEATLIHPAHDLEQRFPRLRHVGAIRRTLPTGGYREFHCYRVRDDVPGEHEDLELVDPFPSPARREGTQARGRFRLDVRLTD